MLEVNTFPLTNLLTIEVDCPVTLPVDPELNPTNVFPVAHVILASVKPTLIAPPLSTFLRLPSLIVNTVVLPETYVA